MIFEPGQILNHYRLVEKIGEGGMGVVWKAEDTKLHRRVAIKVLPADFAADPDRRARFEREAHLLASLNHPNIATIHGLEESNGVHYLILELVEGETLAERIARDPLRIEETCRIAVQIALALEAAHEKGIIHRDLKPGNVMVTPEGNVKVLDFGLAKAFTEESVSGPRDESRSPTQTMPATRTGVILGTAAYMSPEQARGLAVDRRTDIWALGCVVYEMLTRRRVFGGRTVSDLIAAILKTEPDWSTLPPGTPRGVRRLLRRCLAKDPKHRLHHPADARIEIEQAMTEPEVVEPTDGAPSRLRAFLPWLLAGSLAVVSAVAGWKVMRESPAEVPSVDRFEISIPEPYEILSAGPPLSWSPDGSRLVLPLREGNQYALYLRAMDSTELEKIPGTDGAWWGTFSPDGKWILFSARDQLLKVPVEGGVPDTIAEIPETTGFAWAPDGTVVWNGGWGTGLLRTGTNGGTPQVLTHLEEGEGAHIWPDVLPDGDTVLFTVFTVGGFDGARVAMVSLRTGRRKTLLRGAFHGRYSPTGHLLFAKRDVLMAAPFDPIGLEVTGEAVPLIEDLLINLGDYSANFSLSAGGTLAYLGGGIQADREELIWVSRKGETSRAIEDQRGFQRPRLSPDGTRLAVTVIGPVYQVWVYDLEGGTRTRFTTTGENIDPIWSPDGARLVYTSIGSGGYSLVQQASDGSAAPEELVKAAFFPVATSWSSDGSLLAFHNLHPETNYDLWIAAADEPGSEPTPFLRLPGNETAPAFSPDGKWLAYVSNESGRPEIYVTPYPGPGSRWQVSLEGGEGPTWNPSGGELFYIENERMMVVEIPTSPRFQAGTPHVLFETDFEGDWGVSANYAVSPDGQRFLMIRDVEEEEPVRRIHVVLNFFEELKRRVP